MNYTTNLTKITFFLLLPPLQLCNHNLVPELLQTTHTITTYNEHLHEVTIYNDFLFVKKKSYNFYFFIKKTYYFVKYNKTYNFLIINFVQVFVQTQILVI
jgi:hypothetical protein